MRAGRGRGGGSFINWKNNFCKKNVPGVLKRKSFCPLQFFFQKCSWGSESQTHICFLGGGDFGVFGAPHTPTRGSRGVGKQYTSSYDHDPWPAKIPAWRSKVIIRKPLRRKNKKQEKKIKQGNSVARNLPPTGSEANTTICFFYIYIAYRFPLSLSTIVLLWNKKYLVFYSHNLFFLEMLE